MKIKTGDGHLYYRPLVYARLNELNPRMLLAREVEVGGQASSMDSDVVFGFKTLAAELAKKLGYEFFVHESRNISEILLHPATSLVLTRERPPSGWMYCVPPCSNVSNSRPILVAPIDVDATASKEGEKTLMFT